MIAVVLSTFLKIVFVDLNKMYGVELIDQERDQEPH